MPERQYPPSREIPSLVCGDHELRLGGQARGVLSGVSALPDGILAQLWTVTRTPELVGATFAFERLNDAPTPDDLSIVATGDDLHGPVPANLVSGESGIDEDGTDSRHYALWFPFAAASIHGPVRLTVAWPPVGWNSRLELPGEAVTEAAARAISWTDDGAF